MPKPTPNDLLRQLLEIERMLKSSDVRKAKKTELQKLEHVRKPERRNIFGEIENLYAILPELIAAVRKRKDLDRAAYFIGLWHGVILNPFNDAEGSQLKCTQDIFDEFFESKAKPDKLH